MKPAELVQKCADSINQAILHKFPVAEAQVLLVTPQGWKAPPKFPRGEIVQWKENGDRVRYIPAVRLLAWLTANGFCKVTNG